MIKERYTATHVYFVGGDFSQWAYISFDDHELHPNHYRTAEHYMMAMKADLFKDWTFKSIILSSTTPEQAKKAGRQIRNFDADVWNQHARNIVFKGNLLKAQQNEEYAKKLLGTGDRILVEGAHYDPVWGVKLAWDDPKIEDVANWQGTNWLGQCLMAVRYYLNHPEVANLNIEWSDDPTVFGKFV